MSDATPLAYEDADLSGSVFRNVALNGSRFQFASLHHVRMRGVEIGHSTIDGEVFDLVINGVDVVPLIEAELDRRDPDRVAFRPTTADGFRAAWAINRRRWDATVARARRLDPALLQVSVDGEWSFVQTLRHLAFASQSWVARCLLGEPRPWHPLSLPWDQMQPREGVPGDRDVEVPLDEALALRTDTMIMVERVLDDLTDERLAETTEPLVGPGWPDEGATFPVQLCLSIVLNEEYQHRLFAERDLAVLEDPASADAST